MSCAGVESVLSAAHWNKGRAPGRLPFDSCQCTANSSSHPFAGPIHPTFAPRPTKSDRPRTRYPVHHGQNGPIPRKTFKLELSARGGTVMLELHWERSIPCRPFGPPRPGLSRLSRPSACAIPVLRAISAAALHVPLTSGYSAPHCHTRGAQSGILPNARQNNHNSSFSCPFV